MSGFVSVGSTPQTTDIFVCRQHVRNVISPRRRHSLMSANVSSAGVVPVRPVADTHSCMNVGISINEVVTYEVKKKLECLTPIVGRVVISCRPLRFCHPFKDYTTDKACNYSNYVKISRRGGNWKRFQLGDVVGMLLGCRRMQERVTITIICLVNCKVNENNNNIWIIYENEETKARLFLIYFFHGLSIRLWERLHINSKKFWSENSCMFSCYRNAQVTFLENHN